MYSGPLLVHSRPSGLLVEPQRGRYAGIPGAPTTSYLLYTHGRLYRFIYSDSYPIL